MKNRDFAKLAMMGLVGGCLLGSSPVNAGETVPVTNNKGVLLAHGCKGGCGSPSNQGSRSYVADNCSGAAQPRGTRNYQPTNNQPTASGCGSKTRPTNGCNQVADNGCKSSQYRPSNSCGGSRVSDSAHPTSGCHANGCKGANTNTQYQPSQDRMSEKRDAMNQSNQNKYSNNPNETKTTYTIEDAVPSSSSKKTYNNGY